MNFIDKTIAYFNPQAGLKRAASRKAMEAVRSFNAAGRGRRTENWGGITQSAAAEVRMDLRLLRNRSRQLAHNNGWAKKALEVIANNVVGTGIVPAIKSKRLQKLWDTWAVSLDYSNQFDFAGLQWHVMHTVAKTGEAILLRQDTPQGPKVLVLEGDYIDSGKNWGSVDKPESGYTVDGIEFDAQGRATHYWIYDRNPLMEYANSRKIPVDRIIHIFEPLRPGQIRGVPFGVSSMLHLKDLDDYEDAQLVKQKISACFAVFVRDTGSGAVDLDIDEESDVPNRIEPGMVYELGQNQDVSFAQPPSTENFDKYSRQVLLKIASGFGITYEALTGDLSNVNFSSGRMGWLEQQRNVQRWQNQLIINKMCRGLWEWFKSYATIVGIRPTDDQVHWTIPRREMIDPSKEIKALTESVRSGFKTLPEAIRECGYDPMAVLEEQAAFNAEMDKMGVKFVSDPRYFPTVNGGMVGNEAPTNSQD